MLDDTQQQQQPLQQQPQQQQRRWGSNLSTQRRERTVWASCLRRVQALRLGGSWRADNDCSEGQGSTGAVAVAAADLGGGNGGGGASGDPSGAAAAAAAAAAAGASQVDDELHEQLDLLATLTYPNSSIRYTGGMICCTGAMLLCCFGYCAVDMPQLRESMYVDVMSTASPLLYIYYEYMTAVLGSLLVPHHTTRGLKTSTRQSNTAVQQYRIIVHVLRWYILRTLVSYTSAAQRCPCCCLAIEVNVPLRRAAVQRGEAPTQFTFIRGDSIE